MAKAKKAPDATEAFLAATKEDDLLTGKADVAKLDLENLERHPLSEKYGPPLDPEELAGLAADIKAHGQHDRIKLFEGKVLAGWNRYQACKIAEVEPKVEDYIGDNPEAVAFGTNVIRRRMSSVAKAYMGAMYYTSVGGKQIDVAKLCGVSLNRLNQCCQLLKLDTEEAARVREHLSKNPEITGSNFDEMLLECGIARSNPKQPSNVRPIRDGVPMDLDPDLDTDDLEDIDDDLTGGAIDGLADPDLDDEDDGDDPRPRQRKEIGEGAAPIPAVGGKGPSMTNPHETVVSKLAKHFKKLSVAEQIDFVVFAWGKLHPALQAAITSAKVTFEAPLYEEKPAKAKGAAYVAERKAAKGKAEPAAEPAAPKAKKAPVGDAEPETKGKATPAAKKAPKTPAEPAPKASRGKASSPAKPAKVPKAS